MDESPEFVVTSVGGTEFVWKENKYPNESELRIGHVELIEVDVRIFMIFAVGLTSQSNVRTAGQLLSVHLKTWEH